MQSQNAGHAIDNGTRSPSGRVVMTCILSNGIIWGPDSPEPLENLFVRLRTNVIEPPIGSFWGPAHRCRFVRATEATDWQDQYVDEGPLYPEAPDAVSFYLRFFNLAWVSLIDTNDPALIRRLKTAIRENMRKPEYRAQVGKP